MSTLLFADSFKIKRQIAGEVGKEDEPMTIEEKIKRYRGIPKLLKDLQIDKEICTSVKSVQFDSIGEAKGTHGNSTEKKLIDAAEISEKIAALQQERDRLELSIMQHINTTLCGSDEETVDMRIALKKYLLQGLSLKQIATRHLHRDYKKTKELYITGFEKIKNTPPLTETNRE